jgi:acetyl esterase/lipase
MIAERPGEATPAPAPARSRRTRHRPRRTRHRYGPSRAQVADLWLPPAADDPPPVVVLVHGGYWRSTFTRHLMVPLARDCVRRGWAAYNIEYRRVGPGGGGGGWPATFDDVARAVDHLGEVPGVDPGRVVLCGHSAGGHLALWAAGRHRLAQGCEGSGTAGRPASGLRGVVSLAGVVDLASAARGDGAAAVARLLGPDPAGARLAAASPLELLPLGVPQVLVHGRDDRTVPVGMTEHYARRAAAAGDEVALVVVDGTGHRDVIRPRSAAWAVAATHVARLFEPGGPGQG